MNPPPSWSSETPPTPKSRTQGGSTAAAKDEQVAAPTSGWEAACSEGIHVGGNIEGEAAALAALKTHHSILYLSTVRAWLFSSCRAMCALIIMSCFCPTQPKPLDPPT